MDIGQSNPSMPETPTIAFKPFARPKRKRRRTAPSKPAAVAVRPNPAHCILDFADATKSPERTVCSLVLSEGKRNVSLVGLPGSGKTVILRGVAYHPTVMSAFRDGIFLVQLSQATTVASLLNNFLEVLAKLGGTAQSAEVKELLAKTPAPRDAAMELITRFIKDKRLLLILDNVNTRNADIQELLIRLANVSVRTRRYTLLTSTRSHDVARQYGDSAIVEVFLLDATGSKARDIICAHAGFDRLYFDDACSKPDNPVVPVLSKCSGLPLALAVAGGAIKRLLQSGKTAALKEQSWTQYRAYLTSNFNQFGQISGLFPALTSCVDAIEKDKEWRTHLSVWDAFCALGIVPNGVWLPYAVLQRIWGMKRRDDIITIVRPFSRHCILTRDRRGVAVGVSIPDVVLDFCRYQASQRSGLRQWHLNLLRSYVEQSTAKVGDSEKGTVRWDRSAEEDHYLRENIDHHLSQALVNASPEVIEKDTKVVEEARKVIEQHFLHGVSVSIGK